MLLKAASYGIYFIINDYSYVVHIYRILRSIIQYLILFLYAYDFRLGSFAVLLRFQQNLDALC